MPRCGEKNHKARLSDATVREMRATWQRWKTEGDGQERKGYGTLGFIFVCSPWTARDIVLYRTRAGA
jgi:hypothetical protein